MDTGGEIARYSMTDCSIIGESLCKSFKKVNAVNSVTFSVNRAELFGIIGPDGSGKTTLIRILTSLLLPDSGKACVEGYDVTDNYKKIRGMIGYMPGRFSLYQDLTVEENLAFYATVFGTTIKENYDLIKDVYQHIEPFRKRQAGKLSGGMKQKLALSCALIHSPSVLFLDEPTTGVDAVSRKEFWEMLKKLQEKGITILVTTPYMDEASRCNRVALMQKGRFMQVDTPVDIISNYRKVLYAVKTADPYRLIQEMQSVEKILGAFPFGDHVHFNLESEDFLEDVTMDLNRKGFPDLSFFKIKPGIEDCFMDLMSE